MDELYGRYDGESSCASSLKLFADLYSPRGFKFGVFEKAEASLLYGLRDRPSAFPIVEPKVLNEKGGLID